MAMCDARHVASLVLLSQGNGAASKSCIPSHQAFSYTVFHQGPPWNVIHGPLEPKAIRTRLLRSYPRGSVMLPEGLSNGENHRF